MPNDSPNSAAVPAAGARLLPSLGDWPARDAQSAALEAALLDSARAVQALHERFAGTTGELHDMLGRCDALLARATEAARGQRGYVAWDCLQQVERERVLAMSDDERRAEMALALAESRTLLTGWRQDAAEALAAAARGHAPPVPLLQGLLRNIHAARQAQRHRIALVRQQLPALATMLVAAVAFFGLWALLGGFDWLARDDVEVTVGMILVSGVLMGYFGGLVSFAFNWLRADLSARSPDLRTQRWLSLARPMIGAAVAVPIVLFVEAGLINLGQLSPALVLALCFLGGFSERWFVARLDRLAAGAAERG
ncbi:MAG: hypothetical protein MUF32_00480 [Burkholderiaceae bacterium]|jgi:hypothetical protein|nr:hypothetical protein [Burkholderiaceae bacterium]